MSVPDYHYFFATNDDGMHTRMATWCHVLFYRHTSVKFIYFSFQGRRGLGERGGGVIGHSFVSNYKHFSVVDEHLCPQATQTPSIPLDLNNTQFQFFKSMC